MRPPSIIVIDDENIVRAFARRLVTKAVPAAIVVDVASAEEGWELICAGGIDLVVTDCNLTGASGMDLVRNVREQKIPLPMIMISGSDRYRKEAEETGIDRFIEKRHLIDELGSAIQELLREGTRHANGVVAAAMPPR